ncbi:ribbon-helix-helix protein, CopG family [Clavibacter zhangzhiyongii]|uniref:ribbon-helix-helix protein, CopG family n=1 Tax=Clavibacter zhangzhiyongii TaxID=2768071 RepID=UPI001958C6E7|nr:ribbon-helix-helix protein, CopG family [Clavibacter zhangzhiyongii]MBM7025315.1 ribbon-helix-helix protein, CopG family [Clavibacter zhangzhiyongii]
MDQATEQSETRHPDDLPNEPPGASAKKNSGVTRLSVNLNAETAKALKHIAEERQITVTEAIRRAIAVYEYIDSEARKGRRIQTSNQDREDVREFILLT